MGMEVQARYPSSAAPFTPDYPPRKAPRLDGTGAPPFFRINDAVAQLGELPGTFLPQQQAFTNGAAVFSGEPESELTCNASGSRKRAFVDGSVAHTTLQHDLQGQQQQKTRLAHVPRQVAPLLKMRPAPAEARAGTLSSLQVLCDKIRMNDSTMASTSGRPSAEAPVPAEAAPAISPLMEELVTQLYQQSVEVEAFVRLQNERIRSGLEDARKRHHRALLSAMEQDVLRCLREKEADLESASRRNAELEDKIRQLAAENQIWFNVARNNEAIVSSLRATLDQVLHNASAVLDGAAVLPAQPQELQEGYGESDCAAPGLPADDAQSCCYEGVSAAAAAGAEQGTAAARENLTELRLRSACKVCLKREASVLLLPCRHVCLCKQCGSGVDACPVCNTRKSTSLQVFMC